MRSSAPPQFMIFLVGSRQARQLGEAIEYVRAENRVLRGRLSPKRLRFTDAERRLLAEKDRALGRKRLAEVASLDEVQDRGVRSPVRDPLRRFSSPVRDPRRNPNMTPSSCARRKPDSPREEP